MIHSKIQILIDFLSKQETTVEISNDELTQLFELCKFHNLEALLYKAITFYKIKVESTLLHQIKTRYQECLVKATFQDAELQSIVDELTKHKINIMPLKGSILKLYYPSVECRTMSDLDILYDETKQKEVKEILTNLGYTCDSTTGNHDVFFKQPFMNVEMHRSLINKKHVDLYQYFENIWDRSICISPYLYKLSNEDFYLFMIGHIAKHYKVGGVGIRYVFDTHLFLQNMPDLDMNKISEGLKELKLTEFENNLRNLCKYWFNNNSYNSVLEKMTSYIFNSGTHGTIAHEQAYLLKDKETKHGRLYYIFKSLFPSYSEMKGRNPILIKWPILLPWYWFLRLIRGATKGRKLTKKKLQGIKKINQEEKKQIDEVHKTTGY